MKKIIPKNIRPIEGKGFYSEDGELRAIMWFKQSLEKEPALSEGIPISICPIQWLELYANKNDNSQEKKI